VEPGSATQIAASLVRLLSDPSERQRSAREGYQRVQLYSWDLVAERHLARYESLPRRDAPALPQPQY